MGGQFGGMPGMPGMGGMGGQFGGMPGMPGMGGMDFANMMGGMGGMGDDEGGKCRSNANLLIYARIHVHISLIDVINTQIITPDNLEIF